MLITRTRTIIAAAVASAGLAAASIAPAASNAQINNFSYLHSSEYYTQTLNGNNLVCQPLFPVGGSDPTGTIPTNSQVTNSFQAGQVSGAQQTTGAAAGQSLGLIECGAS